VCGTGSPRHLLSGDRDLVGIRTGQCLGCGMIFSNPFYDPDVIDEFYRVAYRSVFKGHPDPKAFVAGHAYPTDRARFFLRLFEQEGVLPPLSGSVLDVGCGEGTLLRALRAARPDLQLHGVEPTASYRANAVADTGVPIAAAVSEVTTDASFDLITCIHVLEHVREPVALLEQIRDRLAPNGWCYVDVPNAAAYDGIDDFHVAHCNHFTAHTLALAVECAGMAVRKVAAHQPVTLPSSLFALTQRNGSAVRGVTPDPEAERIARRLVGFRMHTYLMRRLSASVTYRLTRLVPGRQ
jgi:2-polyprenyl-3-methyl-5-hydroxy-6-metoxy-1,4-benzoquinol methylase